MRAEWIGRNTPICLRPIHSGAILIRMDHTNDRLDHLIATLIVRKLSENHLTSRDLANALGISEVTVLKKLTGQRPFTITDLYRAASLLHCGLEDLVPAGHYQTA